MRLLVDFCQKKEILKREGSSQEGSRLVASKWKKKKELAGRKVWWKCVDFIDTREGDCPNRLGSLKAVRRYNMVSIVGDDENPL